MLKKEKLVGQLGVRTAEGSTAAERELDYAASATGAVIREDERPARDKVLLYCSVDGTELVALVVAQKDHLRPAVPLDLVLVVCISCLQEWLLSSSSTCDLADHGTAVAGDDLHVIR